MATIGDLAQRLEAQTYSLAGRQPEDTVESHLGGWMNLARPTLRAIGFLPVGGRQEYLNASFRAVLTPLIEGPRNDLHHDLRPAPRLLEIGRTVGAIADILADTVRLHPRPELVGAEAVRFEATLLASIYLTARWSFTTIASQTLASTRHSLMALLNDLVVLTEPWAMIPATNRRSALEDLRIPTSTGAGLRAAVTAWADEAADILGQRYRVTGWAMQATAGAIALLTDLARQAAIRDGESQGAIQGEVRRLADTLGDAERTWRAAATWPPNLRLGGSNEELRGLTSHLRDACSTERSPSLNAMRDVLELVEPVAFLQASRMRSLVTGRELWIRGVIPGGQGQFARKWMRVPEWSTAGRQLAQASGEGHRALSHSIALIARDLDQVAGTRPPVGWPRSGLHVPNMPVPPRGLRRYRSVRPEPEP